MIVGVQGVRIKSVSDQCDIDRVVVDRDLHVIRIVGKYPAEVRKARQMLELRVETVEARDDRTRRSSSGRAASPSTTSSAKWRHEHRRRPRTRGEDPRHGQRRRRG